MTSDNHSNANLFSVDGLSLTFDANKVVAVGPDSVYIRDFLPEFIRPLVVAAAVAAATTTAVATTTAIVAADTGAKIFDRKGELKSMYDEVDAAMPWVDPALREMGYRGNKLKRMKAFLVHSLEQIPIYGYPGMQWESLQHYGKIDSVPFVDRLVRELQARCRFNGAPFTINHVIGTLYVDGEKNIGFHSDKLRDIAVDSPILDISLGGRREFHLRNAQSLDVAHLLVLEPGSLFVLGPMTNAAFHHSLVPSADEQLLDRSVEPVEPRISLVMRNISTVLAADEVNERITASQKNKRRADEKKTTEGKKAKHFL